MISWISLSTLIASSTSEIFCYPSQQLSFLHHVRFYLNENHIIWSETVSQDNEITEQEVSPQAWSSQEIPLATPKGDVTHLYKIQNIDDTWYFIIESIEGNNKFVKGVCHGDLFHPSSKN